MNWTRFLFALLLTVVVGSGGVGCSTSASSGSSTVTAVALNLTPSLLSLAAGTSQDIAVTVTYSDGSVKDVKDATWSTSDPNVATAVAGKVTGIKPGAATLTAQLGDLSKKLAVTVTAAHLVSLGITPTAPSIAKGLTKALFATGTFSDNTTQDLTGQVIWASSAASVAPVQAGVVTGVSVGTADITATLSAISASTTVTVTGATIRSIALTPSAPSVAKGFSTQLTATATLTDSTTQNVTTQAAWASADETVATVGAATGLVAAKKAGATSITASLAGVAGTTTVTVTDAVLISLGITPSAPSIAKGLKEPFTATGVFSDNTAQNLTTQVTWTSSDESKATISNAATFHGLATTLAVGQTNITATLGTITASTTLDVTAAELVSIGVTPANPKVAKGLTEAFTATGTYTDATVLDLTSQVTWSSSDLTKAEISNAAGSNGLATTLAVGPTTVTATLGTITGSTVLDVTAAELVSIGVTPATPSIAKGLTQQFAATGTYTDTTVQDVTTQVTWGSSDTAIAEVSNAAGSHGLASTFAVGSVTITATLGSVSGDTTLDVTAAALVAIGVTPATPSVAKGLKQQLTATGTYTDTTVQDLTTQVTWSSTATTIADISNAAGSHGLASTHAVGQTTIGATLGAISGSTTLEVTAAKLVSINVTPATPSVAKGLQVQFVATGTYTDTTVEDLTTQVAWASSDTSKATVSNAAGTHGLASTSGVGETTISAMLGAVIGLTTLEVTAAKLVAIGVTPPTPSVAKGLTQQFTAMGTYTDTTVEDLTTQVTWSSSDVSKATISNAAGSRGLASTVNVGATTIGATLGSVSGDATLTVTAAELVAIGVTPAAPSVAKGLTRQFTATGTYTDTTVQDLTTQVAWASSDTSKATISNAAGSKGLASTVNVGSTAISAALGAVSGSTTLTVSAAALVSIAVTPAGPSVAKGLTQQFTATGTYTDTTTQNLTTQVTWGSSDTSKATISNAAGSNGLASTVATGQTTITATLGSVSGNTTLTVSAATLVSIAVTPNGPSVAQGLTQQFTATGTYTDTTTQNLTTQVTWASSNTARATISNASGSNGRASTSSVGTTTISATLGSVSGSTTLTVSAAELVSIAVTPSASSVAKSTTKQLTATGTYTDATTQVLTAQVTWASSNTTAATISNAAGSQGLATAGPTAGISTTISATLGSVTGSTTLAVVSDSLVGSILATDAQAAQINAWIGTPGRSWQLCYRRSTHGNQTTTFHALCDAATETVTVVSLNKGQSNERLIGGYAPASWGGGPDYVYNLSTAFLFSLTNNFKHAPGGLNPSYSLFTYTQYGPTFGGGHDFLSGSNPVGTDPYCQLGFSYQCRIGSYGEPSCYDDFCGAFYPVVSELEVFMP